MAVGSAGPVRASRSPWTDAPPSTNVVIPSSGATVSGSQTLDAGASSGVTGVQYEITGAV